jgi:hypothetical protein
LQRQIYHFQLLNESNPGREMMLSTLVSVEVQLLTIRFKVDWPVAPDDIRG